jgi:hypothetical protein
MQRLRILGLAFMAVFALSVVVSSAASAGEPTKFLNNKGEQGEFLIKGLFKSNTTLEKLNGKNVTCEEVHYEIHIEPNSNLGLFHIHFLKCTAGPLVTCTGLGDESGQILVLGTFHLVYDSLTTLGAGILFLPEHVHFTCGGLVLILVLGEVLCLITPINTLTNVHKIKCEQASAGDPKEVVYWKDDGSGTEVKLKEALLSTENDEKYEGSSQVGESNVEGTEAKQEFNVMV